MGARSPPPWSSAACWTTTALTAEGKDLRARVEAETDVLSADPWLLLGAERTARVIELGKGFARPAGRRRRVRRARSSPAVAEPVTRPGGLDSA